MLTDNDNNKRFAWARLNADGLLITGLLLLSAVDVLRYVSDNASRALGRPWAEVDVATDFIYLLAGLFMLYGFLRSLVWPEIVGRTLMCIGVTIHTIAVAVADALTSEAWTAYFTWILVVGVVTLRITALLSKDGLTITIPPARRQL